MYPGAFSTAATAPETPGGGELVLSPAGLAIGWSMPVGMEGWDHSIFADGGEIGLAIGAVVVQGDSAPGDSTDPGFTAESVIEAARDRHSSFDKSRHPAPLLLRYLDRYQRSLVARAIERDMSFMAATYAIPLPLVGAFEDGIGLPFAYHLLHGGEVVLVDGTRLEFSLIPYGQRNDAVPYYSGWVSGSQLFFRATSGDWGGVVELVLSYVPFLSRISTLRSVMGLPRSAESVLVEGCAAFMAGRGHNDPELPAVAAGAYIQVAGREEEAWLREIGNRRRTQVKRVREVW